MFSWLPIATVCNDSISVRKATAPKPPMMPISEAMMMMAVFSSSRNLSVKL